jgi:hypothetical protein
MSISHIKRDRRGRFIGCDSIDTKLVRPQGWDNAVTRSSITFGMPKRGNAPEIEPPHFLEQGSVSMLPPPPSLAAFVPIVL